MLGACGTVDIFHGLPRYSIENPLSLKIHVLKLTNGVAGVAVSWLIVFRGYHGEAPGLPFYCLSLLISVTTYFIQ